jgi:hypothetical protein
LMLLWVGWVVTGWVLSSAVLACLDH